MNDKELIRRALMGNKQAQRECTENGIVLPCPCCQSPATYCEELDAVFCMNCGLASEREYKKSIEVWNTRPAPPADVAPVVHGWWKGYTKSAFCGIDDFGEPVYRDATFYCCSKCNRKSAIKEKFCPNCGAKMDLEED